MSSGSSTALAPMHFLPGPVLVVDKAHNKKSYLKNLGEVEKTPSLFVTMSSCISGDFRSMRENYWPDARKMLAIFLFPKPMRKKFPGKSKTDPGIIKTPYPYDPPKNLIYHDIKKV